MTDLDPSELHIDELRASRARLQADDDALSYVRRLAQARLDLIHAEIHRRDPSPSSVEPHGAASVADPAELADDLPAILGGHLTGGPARPPRPADDASDHPLALELERLCARLGSADVDSLDDDEIRQLELELRAFEHDRSRERQELFTRLDALSAELVRRYRDGAVELPDGDD